jgi:7-cyano-7-deazaguanine reductase
MTKQFKALKAKKEFNYSSPDKGLLEWFENPGVCEVMLVNKEFTSLCPVTGQPDYSEIVITYQPNERCVESKSLKLYCMSFRNYGAFTEELSQRIALDLHKVLKCPLEVHMASVSRGGITVTSTCKKGALLK